MTSNPSPISPFPKITPLPRSLYPTPFVFTRSDFHRQDESPDTEWYSQPRFVQHIDDGAISILKDYYSTIITPTSSVLDICSSWVSHLPSSLKPPIMIGIGMNAAELQRNEHLTQYMVKDLNVHPTFREIGYASMDVVICNVSVDYLTQPIDVFEEMRRVLKIGGEAHMAFSNRCFPTKVVGRWLRMDDEERRKWVGGYFWASGGWENVEEVVLKEGGYEDPVFVVRGRKTRGF
ncbi:hypothetical protein sscle_01g008110 [Sclerotinia sclerotiorum 1980 UF-70]|uniref:Methyltransferase type 11 domain-containing protein n=1 Tax=Sclerotinia sclerotiorum (strain ATCC 18683 / 1980 / Ss-1) TaxID=665079 RepID=A0A1D9PTI8_SCLS1|nr:hypothetical protein sscle_01g008110 [Sclerotinia sclerotiorum 1980 UF-70]